jgi:hypothetical protein
MIKNKYTYDEIQQLKYDLYTGMRRDCKFVIDNLAGLRLLGIKLLVNMHSKFLSCEYKDVFEARDNVEKDQMILVLNPKEVKLRRKQLRKKGKISERGIR